MVSAEHSRPNSAAFLCARLGCMGWGPDCTPGRPQSLPQLLPPASAALTPPQTPAWAKQRAERALPGQPEPGALGYAPGRSTGSSSRPPPGLSEVPRSRLCRNPSHDLRQLRVLTPLSRSLTSTSRTAAELEVSGLRRGWAGFQ